MNSCKGVNMHSKRRKYDYGSEFSNSESEADTVQKYDRSLMEPSRPSKMGLFRSSGSGHAFSHKIPSKRSYDAELDKQEGRRMRHHGILAMDAFARHQKFVNDYLIYYGGKREDFKQTDRKYTTEKEIIEQNNKFLWAEESGKLTWEQQLAFKYWKKLYKEYTIADLSRFKEDKIALRWRIEKEVVNGKGQFICGNKTCNEIEGLRSWEVNFAYLERGEKMNALVKLRLCPECSYKLNYRKKKKEAKRKKHGKSSKHKDKDTKLDSNSNQSADATDITSSKTVDIDDHERTAWTRAPVQEDMTREDEFDKYFDDMFL